MQNWGDVDFPEHVRPSYELDLIVNQVLPSSPTKITSEAEFFKGLQEEAPSAAQASRSKKVNILKPQSKPVLLGGPGFGRAEDFRKVLSNAAAQGGPHKEDLMERRASGGSACDEKGERKPSWRRREIREALQAAATDY